MERRFNYWCLQNKRKQIILGTQNECIMKGTTPRQYFFSILLHKNDITNTQNLRLINLLSSHIYKLFIKHYYYIQISNLIATGAHWISVQIRQKWLFPNSDECSRENSEVQQIFIFVDHEKAFDTISQQKSYNP